MVHEHVGDITTHFPDGMMEGCPTVGVTRMDIGTGSEEGRNAVGRAEAAALGGQHQRGTASRIDDPMVGAFPEQQTDDDGMA
jgi:hypothetical protein